MTATTETKPPAADEIVTLKPAPGPRVEGGETEASRAARAQAGEERAKAAWAKLRGVSETKPEPVVADDADDEEEDVASAPAKAASPEPNTDGVDDDAGASADPELEKAITALRRMQIPQSVIKKMTNKEVLAYSAHAQKVVGEGDNLRRELGELRKQMESASKAKESESATSQKVTPAEPPLDLKALEQPIREQFGDEGVQLFGGLAKAIAAPLLERISQLETGLNAAQSVGGDFYVRLVKENLKERFPQITDADTFSKVKERMETLAEGKHYQQVGNTPEERITALMEDAARVLSLKEVTEDERAQHKQAARKRANGRLTVANASTGKQPGAMTPDERAKAAWDRLRAGEEPKAVRRALSGTG